MNLELKTCFILSFSSTFKINKAIDLLFLSNLLQSYFVGGKVISLQLIPSLINGSVLDTLLMLFLIYFL